MPANSISDSIAAPSLRFEDAVTLARRLDDEMGRVIIGQRQVRHEVLICLLAGGHCLLRGVPGLAKTLLIKTLADAVHLKFNRIQFTPDLMPSDILGTEVIEEDATTRQAARPLHRRARSSRTSSSPTRSIARRRARRRRCSRRCRSTRSPSAACAIGWSARSSCSPRENPIEQEGTYPLPEAQLDRFMFNVVIDYPDIDDERRILAETTTGAIATVDAVATGAEARVGAACSCATLPAAANVVDYALRLVRATRPGDATCPPSRCASGCAGASVRAPVRRCCLAPRRGAARWSHRRPRPTTSPASRLPVLRHRLLVNFRAEADGISADHVIGKSARRRPAVR